MASHVNGALSPALRSLRVRAVRPFIGGRVLDFGCNTGALADEICCTSYTGVDVEQDALAQARALRPAHSFFHVDEDLGEWAFDTITLLAVIEYIPDRVKLFRRLRAHLAPEGRLVITSPDPAIGIIRSIGGRLGLLASDEQHLRQGLPSRAQMEADLRQAGLRVTHRSRFMLGLNHLIVASPAAVP